jgi:hypothetical protein
MKCKLYITDNVYYICFVGANYATFRSNLNSKISPFFLALLIIDSNYSPSARASQFARTVQRLIASDTSSLPTICSGKCLISLYMRNMQSVLWKPSRVSSSLVIWYNKQIIIDLNFGFFNNSTRIGISFSFSISSLAGLSKVKLTNSLRLIVIIFSLLHFSNRGSFEKTLASTI